MHEDELDVRLHRAMALLAESLEDYVLSSSLSDLDHVYHADRLASGEMMRHDVDADDGARAADA